MNRTFFTTTTKNQLNWKGGIQEQIKSKISSIFLKEVRSDSSNLINRNCSQTTSTFFCIKIVFLSVFLRVRIKGICMNLILIKK